MARALRLGCVTLLAACSVDAGGDKNTDGSDIVQDTDGPLPGAGLAVDNARGAFATSYLPSRVSDSDQQDPIHAPLFSRPAHPVAGERVDGSTVVPSSLRRERVYAADADDGAIYSFDAFFRTSETAYTSPEPTRMARIGDAIFVTMRTSGDVYRLEETSAGLVPTDGVHVGAEPFDIAVSRNHDRLYVALSQENTVIALDATTLVEVGRWGVHGEPRWLAVSQTGDVEKVWVATQAPSRLRVIEPDTGRLSTLELPALHQPCDGAPLTTRLTGDLTVGPDGSLYVPGTLVNTDLSGVPVPSILVGTDGAVGTVDSATDGPLDSGMPVDPCGPVGTVGGAAGAYGGSAGFDPIKPAPGAMGRFTPVVLVYPPNGGPAVTLAADAQSLTIVGPRNVSRGYPAAVWVEADTVYAAVPGSASVLALTPSRVTADPLSPLTSTFRTGTNARLGANGLTRTLSGRLAVWAAVDRSVTFLDGDDLKDSIQDPAAPDADDVVVAVHGYRVAAPESRLPPEVLEGRARFWSTSDRSMSDGASGVSCESCHTGGRADGITWTFDDFVRQSPTLAGRVSTTVPVTWLGDVPSVADEVHATTEQRMGGIGPTEADAANVAAYVDYTRSPTHPALDAGAVVRGEALFGAAGCAACHAPPAYTKPTPERVLDFEMETNVPTLLGIAGSAPYFHDGSAATLRDVLLRVRDGSMGNTSTFTKAQLEDLEAYLTSL